MTRFQTFIISLIAALVITMPVLAAPGPDETLEDPQLEARAMELYGQLRCVVCQSQAIGYSDAPLAGDMRFVVRERLLAGDSDAEVLDYMQDRYGDYVLMMPPLQANTIFLWALPFLLLLVGGAIAFAYVRRQSAQMETAFSAEEDAQIEALMREEGRE
ncbi:MAG: cytochrome c-type biogenesis protein CcmH [Alphaproteobacteria bacterium]|nr:cytochrome c-type biogenesis protein CcmH [Alphaproteobacteria bacterium]